LRRLRDIAELMDQCGAFTDSHGEQQDHADDAAAIRAALAALLAPAAKPDWQAVRSTPLLGGTSLTARDCYVIGIFCDEVERMAERNMIKTGKLEGAHYAAMRQLRATFPTPNAGGSGGTPSAEGDGSPGGAE
jgi:hypothetical protein